MSSTTAQLEVRLLGGFHVTVGGQSIPNSAWRRKRAADIVKLLALEPTHRLHREQIVDALWPDLDPDAAANNLRVALHRARQRLEEAGESTGVFLAREGDSLVLAPLSANGDITIDVDTFAQAVEAAWRSSDPTFSERALDLYTGELLPENRYDEWVESRRTALRATYLTLLARVAQLYEERGELGKAIVALERAATADPLGEELQVALIRLLALTGQRRAAMEQVVRLVRTLKRELGAEPQPATRELALAIRDRRFPAKVLPLEPARTVPAPPPSQIPTGTVTILTADTESSGVRARDGAEGVLQRFHEIFRRVVQEHGGHVLTQTSESVSAVFPLAATAVEASLAARDVIAASLSEESWSLRARFALHSGEAKAGEGDLGASLAVTSALLAAGHGGQVLLSRATYELVRDALPSGVELHDLGEHRLKGVHHSQRVYQLVGRDLESVFPPLRTSQGRRRTIPSAIEHLIGRERELAEIGRLLSMKRLVTLTGPGGVGKTQLALTVAETTAKDFPDGAALVELAAVQVPELVLPAIARVLGVHESSDVPLLDLVVSAVEGERLLLVVDNCEHLANVAEVLATLLARCSHLTVLATSRARLRIKGEQEYPVSPLAVPDTENVLPTALSPHVGQSAAVTLFVERASAARPDFTLTPDTIPIIAEIVRRLDGLPLAIELAAARVRILSPEELLARLSRPLDVLTGGPRDAPARQQTLRATIAWSFDLLGATEQVFFRRLAVFTGGFTIDATERMAAPGLHMERTASAVVPSDTLAVLEALFNLVDQSLVTELQRADGKPRLSMLQTIHEFALEQLAASGEEPAARNAHASHYLALAEQAREEFKGSEQAAWLERIDVEHDNLRAALSWLFQSGVTVQALRLAAALGWFWWVRGHLSEGRSWLENALATSDDAPIDVRARALYGAGALAEAQGDYAQAMKHHEEALALYQVVEDSEGTADALTSLGLMARDQGDYDRAVQLLDEALATYRATDDRRGAAYALIELGTVASYRGGAQLALALYAEGLDMLRTLQDPRGYAAALTNVATMTFVHGDVERAAPLYEEALHLWSELRDEQGRATVLTNMGEIMQHRGELERAVTLFIEALPIYQRTGDRRNAAAVLANLGQVARERDDFSTAGELLAESLNIYRSIGDKEATARSLEALAGLAVDVGESELSARIFGRAEALRDEIGAPLAMIAADQYARDVSAARRALPEELFAAAWTAGRELSTMEAVTEVARLASGLIPAVPSIEDEALQHFPLMLDSEH